MAAPTGSNTLSQQQYLYGQFVVEGAQDTITAFAGGGQTNAFALTNGVNRISTVATSGDSVKLPAAVPGLEIVVVNSGANPMQVFGAGTDTINDVATATGVSQMPNSLVIYTCPVAGKWYTDGLGTGYAGSFMTESSLNNITANPGGGQGSAVLLTAMQNRVTTVGTAADSVKLPVSAAGMQLLVVNAAAVNAMNLFPATGEQINALGANVAFSVAAGKAVTAYCMNAGQWHTILSA